MHVAADASRVLVYLYFGGGAHQKNIEATHSCDLSPEDTRTKLPAPPRSLTLTSVTVGSLLSVPFLSLVHRVSVWMQTCEIFTDTGAAKTFVL